MGRREGTGSPRRRNGLRRRGTGRGAVIAVVGIALAFVAQHTMGASWRIGVDTTERTDLVTHELFALIRNPIFTALLITQLGTTLMAPTWVDHVPHVRDVRRPTPPPPRSPPQSASTATWVCPRFRHQ